MQIAFFPVVNQGFGFLVRALLFLFVSLTSFSAFGLSATINSGSVTSGGVTFTTPSGGMNGGYAYTALSLGSTASNPLNCSGDTLDMAVSPNIDVQSLTFSYSVNASGVTIQFRRGGTVVGTLGPNIGQTTYNVSISNIDTIRFIDSCPPNSSSGALDFRSITYEIASSDTTPPAAPSTPDLASGSDTGSSSSDNITSDTTPTFTGTAEASSTVALTSSVNGAVGSATADGSGNWSVTTSALSAGVHNITATATDAASNTSVASSALSITVDASAPASPSTPDLDAGSDTGSSSTDNITGDTTPTFTGTAEANGTVTLISSVSGTQGTTTADGSGNWSFTTGVLVEGSHSITATVTDTAGNTSLASLALAITIDTTAPAAPSSVDLAAGSDTGSSNSDNITSDTTPTITGTAEASSTVTLTSSVDGVMGTTSADGSGNWSFTSPALTAGAHSITVTATDAVNNTSVASSALVINIDTTTPTAPSTPDLDAGSDTGSSSTDNLTSDTTPTFTGTAEANSTITLTSSVDGVVGVATADGSGNWSVTASVLSSGSHNLTVYATDSAGNSSATSAALAITIDASAPSAPATPDLSAASDTGSSSTDNITADTTPTITGTAEANSTLTLTSSVDGVVGTTSADGGGNWSITATVLTEGAHSLTATATDSSGNTSSASSALSVTIDTSAPVAPSAPDLAAGSDSGVSNSDDITNDTTPTLTGTAEANSTVTLTSSVDGVVGSATADGSGNWSVTASVLSAGSHNLTVTATDAVSNVSPASTALTITIDTTAPGTPSTPDLAAGSDTGTANNDNITSDTTPTFTGTAEANSTVTLISSVDGAVGSATVDGSGNWSVTSSLLTAGSHNITVTAADAASNTSAASVALTISIDAAAPSAPSTPDLTAGSDTGSSNSDNITDDTTPTVTGTAEANATVVLTSSIGGTVGSATADGSGNWSITASALANGTHSLSVTATDAAGNTSSASSALAVTVDTTAPVAPSAPDLSASSDTGSSNTDNITNDTTPTFSGTAEANSSVTLSSSLDGVVGNATADGSGAWTITTSALSAGSHNISVVATDVVNNISPTSPVLSISIDTTAPSTPSAADLDAGSDSGNSNSDNATNDNTPTLTGTAEAGSQVQLSSSVAGNVGSTTADGSGNWSITSSTLSDGTHNLTVTATDAAGNTSPTSSSLSISVDTSAPAAPATPDLVAGSDSGSSNTDNLTNDSTPTFSGTAEANSQVALISSVSGSIGSASADGSGNWSITASTLTEGAHTITVTATDNVGNLSVASTGLVVTLDLTVPGAVTGSLSVAENVADAASVGTVTSTGAASFVLTDNASGRFSIHSSSGLVSVLSGALLDHETNASHSITIQSQDLAGNTTSTALTVTVTDVNDGPTISGTPTTSVNEDALYSFTPSGMDADAGDSLTYSIANQPSWATFDTNTGELNGTPGNEHVGTTNGIVISVRDSQNASASLASFNLTVVNTNDAPVITGSPATRAVEGVAYQFTPTASDVDVGDTLSYVITNKPVWASFSSATGALTGTPAFAHIGDHAAIVIGVNDGTETVNLASFGITVVGDLDGDGTGDDVDGDIDGDGMSNEFENDNGLDPLDASDAALDSDGDGVSNLDESLAGSDPNLDDYAPLVTAPQDIEVDATGLLTAVNLGVAEAVDGLDGALVPESDAPDYFRPGLHSVVWTISDAAGNEGTAIQWVRVNPLVSFSKNQQVAEGASVSFKVILNGPAATYPVTVPYVVSGSAESGVDHTLVDGFVEISDPETEAQISFSVADDAFAEGMETIIVSMGDPTNAVVAVKNTHRIEIYESNVAPSVTLSARQNGTATRVVGQLDGMVVVSANIRDPNPTDTHTVTWQSGGELTDLDLQEDQFTFDPADLGTGLYRLLATVDDGEATATAELLINVIVQQPVLNVMEDSDGDGVDDATEGFADSDQDGIADYLDSVSASNTLQEVRADGSRFLMEANPGLSLALGEVALQVVKGAAGIDDMDLAEVGLPADRYYEFDADVVDFVVSGLPVAGDSVDVVVPQQVAIPAGAVYRKLGARGWTDFVENADNVLMSAPGAEGVCPPPGDSAYEPGLNRGYWCVQLTIADGGPNDADGEMNQTVVDPGGVGVPVATEVSISGRSKGSSGGSSSPWFLFALMALLFGSRVKRRLVSPLMGALLCGLVVSPAANAWYLGADLGPVKSNESEADFNQALSDTGEAAQAQKFDTDRNGWRIYIGEQIQDFGRVELSYMDLRDAEVAISGTVFDANLDSFLDTVDENLPAAGRGVAVHYAHRLYAYQDWRIDARLGIFSWSSKQVIQLNDELYTSKRDGTDFSFGFMVNYQVVEQWEIRAAVERFSLDDEDVNFLSFGLVRYFERLF
ncbi:MAG: Ig-like domain-containing protein [Pseudomonadota bacterium]|nr:Ig-like domain-containing protein [Pseudomonadota bacterium]